MISYRSCMEHIIDQNSAMQWSVCDDTFENKIYSFVELFLLELDIGKKVTAWPILVDFCIFSLFTMFTSNQRNFGQNSDRSPQGLPRNLQNCLVANRSIVWSPSWCGGMWGVGGAWLRGRSGQKSKQPLVDWTRWSVNHRCCHGRLEIQ